MPRYDVFLEGRTENSTCYFGVAVMADDQKEAEFLGHEAGRVKHQECDEIEVVGVMPVISARNAGKGRLCQRIPLKERALKFVKEAMEKPIFSFMGVPITEDSASKLKEAMKKCGVSALEVAEVCERFAKIARATLDELPDGNKEEEHDD